MKNSIAKFLFFSTLLLTGCSKRGIELKSNEQAQDPMDMVRFMNKRFWPTINQRPFELILDGINGQGADGRTALGKAAEAGDRKVVEWLLDCGADVAIVDRAGCRAIDYAMYYMHRDIIDMLIEAGADVDLDKKVPPDNMTALERAIREDRLDMVRYFLNQGATNNQRVKTLCIAAEYGRLDIVQWLVKEGKADVDAQDKYGYTALHGAAFGGHLEIVQWLIKERKADVGMQANNGGTALHRAAGQGHLEVVQWLVKEGKADVHAQANDGYTALHRAAWQGHLKVVQWLVEEGKADVDMVRFIMNNIPYHYQSILDGINRQGADGRTALGKAAEAGDRQVVQWLLDRGADVAIVDRAGCRAIDYAMYYMHRDVIDMLIEAGS